ncbi:TetR-like C-terminal domain-containing protein [Paractinoplanes rhizophilus]|uniref:TetR-like C-terminal domain-containing protein n=1 Tax=Paractinoplanes rhizophilus TaxID=1416877 RepID=A0ABW2HUH9_9ACTN
MRAASRAKADLHIPIPDEGSYPADLRAFLAAAFALGSKPRVIETLRALMAEAQINPAFGERFRTGFLQRRRDALAVLVDRARTRGDLPPTPRAGTIAGIVFGVIWCRVLATREPVDDSLVDELVSVLGAGDTPTRASASRR